MDRPAPRRTPSETASAVGGGGGLLGEGALLMKDDEVEVCDLSCEMADVWHVGRQLQL